MAQIDNWFKYERYKKSKTKNHETNSLSQETRLHLINFLKLKPYPTYDELLKLSEATGINLGQLKTSLSYYRSISRNQSI